MTLYESIFIDYNAYYMSHSNMEIHILQFESFHLLFPLLVSGTMIIWSVWITALILAISSVHFFVSAFCFTYFPQHHLPHIEFLHLGTQDDNLQGLIFFLTIILLFLCLHVYFMNVY